MKQQRAALAIALALLAGGTFGWLGSQAWKQYNNYKTKSTRIETTRAILDRMRTIEIGMTLDDHIFENLDESSIVLSDLVAADSVLICIIQPQCEACEFEIQDIDAHLRETGGASHFIFVSSANPRLLRDLSAECGSDMQFLYDHRGQWLAKYDIYMFPFNIIVDSNLVVRDIVVGGISPEEIALIGGS